MLNTNTKTAKTDKSYKKANENSLDFYVSEERSKKVTPIFSKEFKNK